MDDSQSPTTTSGMPSDGPSPDTAPQASEASHAAARRRAARGDDQLPTEQHPISELQATVDSVREEYRERSVTSASEPPPPAAPDTEPGLDATEQFQVPTVVQTAAAPPSTSPPTAEVDPLEAAIDVLGRLQARVRAQVLGRDEVIDLVLVALLADGHVLLEDFPGSGKTTLAKSLGQSIVDEVTDPEAPIAPFRRIQFTPDLLPSDVTGVTVFDATRQAFHFRHGPLFAHVVLADEINRTSPKVQAAMLEAMAEKQVTVDNVTHPLDRLFFVIATQNPLDLAGTYPLPVAQLDRFLFKIRMEHIDRAAELEVLETWRSRRDVERADLPKVTRDEVLAARAAIDERVALDPRIRTALVDLAQALRADERVIQGCSTRSLVLMLPALQAQAALRGRDYVSSDDLETLVPRVLGHRLELAPGIADAGEVIADALSGVLEELARSTLRTS
ncbi:MAG: AAA family ATPase [Acidobacteriota bacterium]